MRLGKIIIHTVEWHVYYLLKIKDSFQKILIVKSDIKPYIDYDGILIIGIFDFLLKDDFNLYWLNPAFKVV